MNADLKTQLDALEAEYVAMHIPLLTLRRMWESMRDQTRPIEQRMTDLEVKMDSIRLSPRYRELEQQLPHLRKAVGV